MKRIGAVILVAPAFLLSGCPSNTDNNGNENANVSPNPPALNIDIAIENEGATHVATGTDVSYRSNPPASGSHWPTPAQPGFYPNGVATEQWVHNLEHGYIVILYDCRGTCDAALLENLQQFAESVPASSVFGYAKIVITPYDGLPDGVLITAVAWDVQRNLAAFDEGQLRAFFDAYQDQGPELAG